MPTIKIEHMNPNCINSTLCEPHGEQGEVFYSSKSAKILLKEQARKVIEELESLEFKDPYVSGINYAIGILQKYL